MWNHQQPHLYDNLTHLELDMTLNKNFAKVVQEIANEFMSNLLLLGAQHSD
jgi:heparan sulfate-N-deacetylase